VKKLFNTVHPHMLRYSTGFYFANKGQDARAIQAYLKKSNFGFYRSYNYVIF